MELLRDLGEVVAEDESPDPPIESVEYDDREPLLIIEDNTSRPSVRPRNIIWRQQNLIMDLDGLVFQQNSQHPPTLLELDTPYQIFSYFFTNELQTRIVLESNTYATQKSLSNPYSITTTDLNKFLGILVYSTVATTAI